MLAATANTSPAAAPAGNQGVVLVGPTPSRSMLNVVPMTLRPGDASLMAGVSEL